MILSAIPALYALYLRWNLPDSPRFQKVEKRPSVIENIKSVWSGEYRKATIMLWILWFSVVFSYYGMFLWLPSVMVLKGFSLIKKVSNTYLL